MDNSKIISKSEIDIYVTWIQNYADEFSRIGTSINDTQIQVSEIELNALLDRFLGIHEMMENDLKPKIVDPL